MGKLVDRHWVLVEVVAERCFVVDVTLLLDVKGLGAIGVELPWDGPSGVVELLKERWLIFTKSLDGLYSVQLKRQFLQQ